MAKSKNNFFFFLLLITISIGFFPLGKFNFIAQLIFVLIGLISILGILFNIKKGEGYSLNTVYWLFNYTFFFIAPLTQFKFQTVFQSDIIIKDFFYIKAGLTILVASITYFLLYNFFYKKIKTNNVVNFTKELPFFPLFALSIIASFLFLYLIKFNLNVVIYRPPSGWLKENTLYGNLGYAIVSIIRYVPFFCLLLYLISRNKNKKVITALTFITLLITFPLSLSRGVLAALYVPLIILFFPILKKRDYFLGLFLISIFFIFPFVNSFRDITTKGFVFSFELFNSPHFDAFQNFMLLLNENIVTNGSQFVDAIFFLNEGRKGSGQLLGEQLGFDFLNIAMPFLGEGFINFSYLGILIFVILIAVFNAFLDKKRESLPLPIKAIYFVLIGFEFYILRGDLSSSIKKMVGFLLALFIVVFTLFVYNKIFKVKSSQ